MGAHLTDIFPDPDVLSQLAPEDLAPVVLGLARDVLKNGKVDPQQIFEQVNGPQGRTSKAGHLRRSGAAPELRNA